MPPAPMQKPPLTIDALTREAADFAERQPLSAEPSLYGVTDGKAIGTLLEQRFHSHLAVNYQHLRGSSSRGRDLPGVNVDLKTTSTRQPQSSCPYRSATQKVCGLGYSLLIFVYDKIDVDETQCGQLTIVACVFVEQSRTADFQTTAGLRDWSITTRAKMTSSLFWKNADCLSMKPRRVVEQAGTIDGVVDLMVPSSVKPDDPTATP
jgi:hypothetical protein